MSKWNRLAVYASVVMITTVAFFVVISPRASAGTPVGGFINKNTVWGEEGSPYWVVSDVIVCEGATLVITVGVEVLFNGSYSIYVEEGSIIWIEYDDPEPQYTLFSWNTDYGIAYPGCWGALQFNDSSYDNSRITDSVIEYATYGVRLESASPTIRNNTIRYCTYGVYSNYSCPTIENNTIENCTEDGIYIVGNDPGEEYANIRNNVIHNYINYGIALYNASNPQLRNNVIGNCSYGIYGSYSSPKIENNTIENCTEDGIYIIGNEDGEYVNIRNNVICNNTYYGIALYDTSNPLLRNNTIGNCGYGIYGSDSSPKIENNTIEFCTEEGIHVVGNDGCDYTNLENNTVYNNTKRGIVLFDVCNVRMRNNSIANSTYNFGVWADTLSEFDHDIDDSNTVDTKTIYYWRNHEHDDESIPSNAGYVGIVNSTNIDVKDLTLTHNGQGVLVGYSNFTTIDNVTASDDELGMILFYSTENTVENSNVSYNDYNGYYSQASGIYLRSSSNNTITNSTAFSNYWAGIYLYDSSAGNIIFNNTCNSNKDVAPYSKGCGIRLVSSSNNTLTNNTCNSNTVGIGLYQSSDNLLANNTCNLNIGLFRGGLFQGEGISLGWSSNNNITNCKLLNNKLIGIALNQGSINIITNCNSSNNEVGINIQSTTGNIITNCDIFNNDNYGIGLLGASSATITYSDIISNKVGVRSDGYSNPTIHNNTISGNTEYGVKHEGTTVSVHAEYNYWGASDGPWKDDGDEPPPYYWYGGGDEVSNYVYFYPFLSSPP